MIILAQSQFSVDQTDLPPGPSADSKFTVDVEGPLPDSLFSVETIGSGALGLVAPSGTQAASLIVVHDGVDHRESELARDETAAISYARDGITFQFATHAFSGDEVAGAEEKAWHGYEIDRFVAPPGADSLDLVLDVQLDPDDDTSVQRYPLITEGRAWDSTRALIGHDAMQIGGGSYLSRFEGVLVDVFRKPAGEELTHGEIIKSHLLAAGIPAARIAISSGLGHNLAGLYEISCFPGVEEAQRVAEAIGHFLIDNAEGNIVARPIAPVELPPVAVINIEHLETAEVTAEISARSKGLPTAIRIEGQRPEDPDDAEGFVATRKLESRVIKPFTTPATWSQDIAGVVSQVRAEFTEDRIVSEIWVQEVKFKGCVVQTRHETWGQFNPEVWRYETESPATIDGEPRSYRVSGGTGFIFATDVTTDGTAPMRRHFDFQLHPIAVQQNDFLRDGPDGFTGALIQTIESLSEWGTIEEARKASTLPSTNWEAENVRAALKFFGGGRIVAGLGGGNAEEVWFEGPGSPQVELGDVAGMGTVFLGGNASLPGEPVTMRKVAKFASQKVVDISIEVVDQPGTSLRELKFERRRETVAEGYGIDADGPAFQYRDSSEANDSTHRGILLSTETQDFVSDGESTHTVILLRTSGKGINIAKEFLFGQPSFLPRADICNDETGALENTVQVFGRCEITSAIGDLVPRVEIINSAFMEDESSASEVACRLLRDRTANEVMCSLPVSPLFYSGAPVIFRAVHKGIDPNNYINGTTKLSNAWVESVELQTVRDGATVQRVVILTLKLPIF